MVRCCAHCMQLQPLFGSPHADDSKPASHHTSSAPAPAMSTTAVAALTQLLHACLADQAMPSLQDIMRERQEKLDSGDAAPLDSPSHASATQASTESASGDADKASAAERQVEVRWYDARARTALKKVAEWINVPWSKMAVFECLAAEQAQVSTLCHGDVCTKTGSGVLCHNDYSRSFPFKRLSSCLSRGACLHCTAKLCNVRRYHSLGSYIRA